jgi:hypothetical protein
MDELVKVWVLLGSGLFLWLVPPAFKFGKIPAVICFNGAIACLTVATSTSQRLIKIESLIKRQALIEDDLIDSELAWQSDQREEQLKQHYLIDSAIQSVVNEPIETDCKAQLERNLAETDRLVNELIDRKKLEKKPEEKIAPLLSKGSQKLFEYAVKKDWLELRTLAKNWGKHSDFNSKEVESFCHELVKAELAEWSDGGKWRVIPKNI